jgi:hypothetical protein
MAMNLPAGIDGSALARAHFDKESFGRRLGRE